MSLNKRFDRIKWEWVAMPQVHPSTFEYLKPSQKQLQDMATSRTCFARFAAELDAILPPGADKTYIFRQLRTLGMWANVSISRHADGTPRTDEDKPDEK